MKCWYLSAAPKLMDWVQIATWLSVKLLFTRDYNSVYIQLNVKVKIVFRNQLAFVFIHYRLLLCKCVYWNVVLFLFISKRNLYEIQAADWKQKSNFWPLKPKYLGCPYTYASSFPENLAFNALLRCLSFSPSSIPSRHKYRTLPTDFLAEIF